MAAGREEFCDGNIVETTVKVLVTVIVCSPAPALAVPCGPLLACEEDGPRPVVKVTMTVLWTVTVWVALIRSDGAVTVTVVAAQELSRCKCKCWGTAATSAASLAKRAAVRRTLTIILHKINL